MPKPQKKRESKAEKPKRRLSAFAAKIGRRKSLKGEMEEELDPTKVYQGSTKFYVFEGFLPFLSKNHYFSLK